jgi:hypothetical protein
MAKYRVTLGDGRTLDVFAPSEDAASLQAAHAEATRVEIASRRAQAAAHVNDDLKAMVNQYGPVIVTQIMRATQPDFVMPDFDADGTVIVAVTPASQAIAVAFLKD